MNDQSDQQCKFIGVHTALSRGALTVGVVVRKLGSVWGVNISLSAVQTPIRQKQSNFEFHIFAPPNAATLHMPPGAHAALSPFPPPLLLLVRWPVTRCQTVYEIGMFF